MDLVRSTMLLGTSTRSGSVLSGDVPGKSRLDLNRQMVQTSDPQGIYVTDAAGSPFGFTNDHGYEDIRDFLAVADSNVRQNGLKNVAIPESALSDMFHVPIPNDVSVLEVLERIPNVPAGCSLLNKSLGRDFAWIWMHEQKQLFDALQTRSLVKIPASLGHRLGRFHLVDGVRGTPTLWNRSELIQYSGQASIVEKTSSSLLAKLDCSYAMRTRDGHRKYKGQLRGLILFDAPTWTLSDIKLVAKGLHFGNGIYTPNAPKGNYQLVTAFQFTTSSTSRIVPPEKVATDGNIREYKHPT